MTLPFVILERAISSATQISSIFLCAYYKPKEEVGLFFLVIAILIITNFFGQLGMSGFLIKKISNKKNIDKLIHSAILIKIMGNLAGMVALILVAAFINNDLLKSMLLCCAFAAPLRTIDITDIVAQSKRLFKEISIIKIGVTIFIYILQVCALILEFDILIFAVIFFTKNIIINLSLLIIEQVRRVIRIKIKNYELRHIVAIIKITSPVTIGTIFYLINSRSDQYLLSFWGTPSELALYGLAVQMTEGAMVFVSALMIYYYPTLSRENKIPNIRNKTTLLVLKNLITLILFLFFTIIIVTPFVINYFFYPTYTNLISLTLLHSITIIALGFREFMSRWIVITGNLKLSFISHFSGACTNVISNLALIPLLGYYGASLSSILSYFVSGILVFYFHPATSNDIKHFLRWKTYIGR